MKHMKLSFQKDRSLPYGKCFISHSYKDERDLDLLRECLPKGAEPIIFPPISVSPEEMVSNNLIETIKDCDTLLYLRGGHSTQSGWVTLERDYALRNGLDVYSFEAEKVRIERDVSEPIDLPIFASYSRKDKPEVLESIAFMRKERAFDIFTEDQISPGENVVDSLAEGLHSRLKKGGYLTLFWSNTAAKSVWVKREVLEAVKNYEGQVMPALIEPVELPEELSGLIPVKLYNVDKNGIDKRRLDDLIVRLYWLIYRNDSNLPVSH